MATGGDSERTHLGSVMTAIESFIKTRDRYYKLQEKLAVHRGEAMRAHEPFALAIAEELERLQALRVAREQEELFRTEEPA